MTFTKNMNNAPSQHVAPCNGNTGYSLPTRARIANGDKYQGGADDKIRNTIAFEDPTHSRGDGAQAPIAVHIRILVAVREVDGWGKRAVPSALLRWGFL